VSDEIQDDIDSAAEWSQAELEQQQRYREELIRACKREPLPEPMPDMREFWRQSNEELLARQRSEAAQLKALCWGLDRIFDK
jgi:hypothetical protein